VIGSFKSCTHDTRVLMICSESNMFYDNMHPAHIHISNGRFQIYPTFSVSDAEMSEVVTIYGLMKAKIEKGTSTHIKEYLEAMGSALSIMGKDYFSRTGHLSKAATGSSGARAQAIFMNFMKELNEHHQSERMLAFYAEKCCVTPKYLSQVVHDVSGKFASEWIRDMVIMDAKALLRSRRYAVQQVAEMMGFDNTSFFGKYFKSATGMSPRAFMMLP